MVPEPPVAAAKVKALVEPLHIEAVAGLVCVSTGATVTSAEAELMVPPQVAAVAWRRKYVLAVNAAVV